MGKIDKSRAFMKISLIALVFGLVTFSGCEDLLTGCLGCTSLTPWSCGCNSTCYGDKAGCEQDSGQECYKCE
jgi:hypothetical protein